MLILLKKLILLSREYENSLKNTCVLHVDVLKSKKLIVDLYA